MKCKNEETNKQKQLIDLSSVETNAKQILHVEWNIIDFFSTDMQNYIEYPDYHSVSSWKLYA